MVFEGAAPVAPKSPPPVEAFDAVVAPKSEPPGAAGFAPNKPPVEEGAARKKFIQRLEYSITNHSLFP